MITVAYRLQWNRRTRAYIDSFQDGVEKAESARVEQLLFVAYFSCVKKNSKKENDKKYQVYI